MTGKVLLALTSTLLAVSACGGGSNSNPSSPNTGKFIDSAVENIAFATETISGTTNSEGEFTYNNGEQITFSIGSVVFPAVDAEATITPVTLSPSNSISDNTAINIATLLQSLDDDGDPDNGILIAAGASQMSTAIDFSVSPEVFALNADVINLVANSGSINTTLITNEAALSHLSSTLAALPVPGQLTDGAWYQDNDVYDGSGDFVSANSGRLIVIEGSNLTSYFEVRDESVGPDVDPFRCWQKSTGTFNPATIYVGYAPANLSDFNLATTTCSASEPVTGQLTDGAWYQDNDVNGVAYPGRLIVIDGSNLTSYLEIRDESVGSDEDPFRCWQKSMGTFNPATIYDGYAPANLSDFNLATTTC